MRAVPKETARGWRMAIHRSGRSIEDRIEQLRSLIRNTVDRPAQEILKQQLKANVAMAQRLIAQEKEVIRNGYQLPRR